MAIPPQTDDDLLKLTPPLPQALYLTEPGDSNAVSITDIHQGSYNDCYILASIGALALNHPDAITDMITVNPDGTETVRLYIDADTGKGVTLNTKNFRVTYVTVDNVFPSRACASLSRSRRGGGGKQPR